MSPVQPANNWMTHIAGEIALFRTNGPVFYNAGLAHRLLVDDRLFLVSDKARPGMQFNICFRR
jgi:hypothetical protein